MTPLPPGPYDVIYADPPWTFETYSAKGKGRSAEKHYECMTLCDIASMHVGRVSGDRSILYLWSTSPHLSNAMWVMAKWGFTYKTSLVWVKDRIGTGYWARNRHELLLIGTHGSGVAQKRGLAVDSVIVGQQREHSRKPDRAREIIERYHPDARKLELFARTRAPGWDVWGNEVEKFAA